MEDISWRHVAQCLVVSAEVVVVDEVGEGLLQLAEELGVSIDYLLCGKEGIITDTIPAIKADKRLKLKAKRALIALVEELCEPAVSEEG